MDIVYKKSEGDVLFENLERGDLFVIAPGYVRTWHDPNDIYMKILTPSGVIAAVNLNNGTYFGAVGGLHVVKKEAHLVVK